MRGQKLVHTPCPRVLGLASHRGDNLPAVAWFHIHRTPILTNHTSSTININIGDRYIDIDWTYVESGDIHVSIFGENRCGAAAPEA